MVFFGTSSIRGWGLSTARDGCAPSSPPPLAQRFVALPSVGECGAVLASILVWRGERPTFPAIRAEGALLPSGNFLRAIPVRPTIHPYCRVTSAHRNRRDKTLPWYAEDTA